MNNSFNNLRYFIEVAALRNITKASKSLSVTQPTLSSAIKRLEMTIETALFIRTKKGVVLTQAGKKFLPKAKDIIDSWDYLKTVTKESQTEIKGKVSIGCHPSVGIYSLPHILPSIFREQKEIDIRIEHNLSSKITQSVIDLEIDVAIAINPKRHPDLIIKEVASDVVTFWKSKKTNNNNDISKGEAILLSDGKLLQTLVMSKRIKNKEKLFKRYTHCPNLEVLASLIKAGAGVGIIPTRVVKEITPKSLVEIPNMPTLKDKICIIYRVENKNIARIRYIVEKIEEHFSKAQLS